MSSLVARIERKNKFLIRYQQTAAKTLGKHQDKIDRQVNWLLIDVPDFFNRKHKDFTLKCYLSNMMIKCLTDWYTKHKCYHDVITQLQQEFIDTITKHKDQEGFQIATE